MEKFTHVKSNAAYLPFCNVDTDMIIPKQYLKTIKRVGLGKFLFAELRYDMQGRENSDFILNQKRDAAILLTGENFGCGSSREHAPWALWDFGIRVIIAPSFAEIFHSNALKNGILLITLEEEKIEALSHVSGEISIDLENQSIQANDMRFSFDIAPHQKEVLLKGLDDIEKILSKAKQIADFEKTYQQKFPWL